MADEEKRKSITRAKLACGSGLFEMAAITVNQLVKNGVQLTVAEAEIYDEIATGFRSKLKVFAEMLKDIADEGEKRAYKELKDNVENELRATCREALGILQTYLFPMSANFQEKIICLKMRGKFYGFMAELESGAAKTEMVNAATISFGEAIRLSEENLPVWDSLRLNVILDVCVFNRVSGRRAEAIKLATETLENVATELDSMDEDRERDCAEVVQKIIDSIQVWTAEGGEDPAARITSRSSLRLIAQRFADFRRSGGSRSKDFGQDDGLRRLRRWAFKRKTPTITVTTFRMLITIMDKGLSLRTIVLCFIVVRRI